MFYLREGFKILKGHFLLSLVLMVSIIGMQTVVSFKDHIKKEVSEIGNTSLNDYFNALVTSNSNVDAVKRKMKQLPGVSQVAVSSKNDIKNEINHLQNSFGVKTINKLSALSYTKIKIELEKNLSLKNQNLIREYLERLIGKENITLGAIKKPSQRVKSKSSQWSFLFSYIEYYLFGLFFVLSFMSIYLFGKISSQSVFIIEKFQRRRFVKAKLLSSVTLSIVVTSLVLHILLTRDFNLYYFLPFIFMCGTLTAFSYPNLLAARVRK